MGAVTVIMYSSRDPDIIALVIDSPFLNLRKLAKDIAKT